MRRPMLPLWLAVMLAALPAAVLRADDASTALREADDLAEDCDFAGAARRLGDAEAAGVNDTEVRGRREDCELAARGLDLLAGLVTANPDRFKGLTLKRGLTVTLTGADTRGMDATVRGGTTRLLWSSLERKGWDALWKRAKAPTGDLVPLAALLWNVGVEDPAEDALVTALGAGADAGTVAKVFARWMEEDVPDGGYVVHDERLMSAADRDAEILEDRKADAYQRLMSGDPVKEAAAAQELIAMGPPARFTLYKGLRSLRMRRVEDLALHKMMTSPGVRERLKRLLKDRRAAALLLIEDAVKYPYNRANPTKKGQKEVNELVDKVREVWDTPLDLVMEWDATLKPLLARVHQVDEWLEQAEDEEEFEADMESVHAAVRDAIGVREFFPDEYSKDVLAFNLEVKTTADPEERDNVLIVNEYRMMMGRKAVRIQEQILRAARGHSRHMKENNYFSHNNKFKGLETPGKRAKRQGYKGGVGENIAMGRPTGRGAFWGWFHSSGHHRNMVGKNWRELGAGRSGAYFTQLFGRAAGDSLNQPKELPPPEPDVAPDPPEESGR